MTFFEMFSFWASKLTADEPKLSEHYQIIVLFLFGPTPPLDPVEILPDRVVPVDDRFVPDERDSWSEPRRSLALTSEPAWPGSSSTFS